MSESDAAHVREQRADGDGLRRDGDVDGAGLDQLGIRRPVDERDDLVGAEALREHGRQNVRLFRVGERREHVRAVDVLLDEQLLVGAIAVQDDGVLEQLGRADTSITDLAEKFHMTVTGMRKHVGVLEQAGLVTTEKVGRVRICKLGLRRLEEEAAWIERYRQLWEARFDDLDKVVEEFNRKEKVDGRTKR